MIRPTALFVFGMGRSGTSALTRVLSLAGAELPSDLLGPAGSNERGHWEPARALEINDAFLLANGSHWYDPSLRLQDEDYIATADEEAYLDKIRAFLLSCTKYPLLIIKDPRIPALSKYWMRAADDLSFDVKFVIPVRRPAEVVGSLTSPPYSCTPELAAALWLKYNLLAERHSRGRARVFVEYYRLLDNWRREVGRVACALNAELDTSDNKDIDLFLERSLNHHEAAQNVENKLLSSCDEIYDCLACAARDEHFDEKTFDQCYTKFALNEQFSQTAHGEFAMRS